MNNYIILFILFLVIIILYFTYKYDKNNIEKFTEADININQIVNFLQDNNLNISDTGLLQINNKNSNLNVIIDPSGNINIGDKYQYNPISKEIKCDKYNLDNNNNFYDNNFNIDSNGNININDFNYDIEGNITRKDKSFNIDSNGNINTDKFTYSTTGEITSKDNTIKTDPSGNFEIFDYVIKLKENTLKKNVGNFEKDNMNNFKCDIVQYNKNTGTKIKLGDKYFKIDNGNLIEENNSFMIDKIGYKLYPITKITLEKTNDTYINPLHISSIRFFDNNNNPILPNNYNVTINNIANGQFDLNGYYNSTKNMNQSYGGPKVDSYSLYWNKTIGFNNDNTPKISPITEQNYLSKSHFIVGHGTTSYLTYIDGMTRPSLSNNFNYIPHSYTFNFNKPVFIKYVEIENRKDNYFARINNSYLKIYTTKNNLETLINTINCFQSSYSSVINGLTPPNITVMQNINKAEKYTAENYNTTSLPLNYDPIVRYYIQ